MYTDEYQTLDLWFGRRVPPQSIAQMIAELDKLKSVLGRSMNIQQTILLYILITHFWRLN